MKMQLERSMFRQQISCHTAREFGFAWPKIHESACSRTQPIVYGIGILTRTNEVAYKRGFRGGSVRKQHLKVTANAK